MPTSLLVVDDNPAMRSTLALILTASGHTVYTEPNGVAAIRTARGRRVDLVIMDCDMPVLDGIAACSELRHGPESEHRPRVWLMSASPSPSMTTVAAAGAERLLRKPFRLETVLTGLEDPGAPVQ